MKKAVYALAFLLGAAAALWPSGITQSAYNLIENAGSALTMRTTLNFTGTGVSVADNAGKNRTDVTIPGGSGGNPTIAVSNASSTGTTTSTLTKLTGAPSTAIISSSGDTGGAIGICTAACGTTGTATITIAGTVNCVFDGSTTAGDYVQISASTNGDCTDTGASTYPSSNQVIGRVLSTNVGAGTYGIDLFPSEIKANSGGGGGGSTTRGTYSTAPSCSTSGSVYYATDIGVVEQCNGSTYQPYAFGIPVTLPGAVSFSWRNQGGASVNANGFVVLTIPTSASNSLRGREIALPSKPFTLDACMSTAVGSNEYNSSGLYETDGTKVLTFGYQTGRANGANQQGAGEMAIGEWTNVTTFSSFVSEMNMNSQTFCLRWNDDSTNNNWSWSTDGGASWSPIGSAGDTAYLTPTNIGFFGNQNTVSGGVTESANLTIWHWLAH
jgi:hypothetical protein